MASVDCESLMFFIRRIDRRRSLFPSLFSLRVYTFFGARMIFCPLRQLESFGAVCVPCVSIQLSISAAAAAATAAAVHPPG